MDKLNALIKEALASPDQEIKVTLTVPDDVKSIQHPVVTLSAISHKIVQKAPRGRNQSKVYDGTNKVTYRLHGNVITQLAAELILRAYT
jgi:hypothetical protein